MILLAAPLLLSFSMIESGKNGKIDAVPDREIAGQLERELQTLYIPGDSLDINVPEIQKHMYHNQNTKKYLLDFYSDIAGSGEFAELILAYSDRYELPYSFVFSLVWTESKFNYRAVNYNRDSIDRGLFQLNNRSFPELNEKDFFRPEINVSHGTRYLKWCLDKGGNEIVALAMYNAGRTKVEKNGTPRRTLDYISAILDYQRNIDKKFIGKLEESLGNREIAFLVN